ncbi:MAG: hypothetical protein H7Y27_07685 [Gemmatimonadaceae bacterium]|nr:hypothetical protein [Chitinophagaceae bacterium]
MIAYSQADMDNQKLYSPNIFIRIGLFILTVIITGFSLGLFSLVVFSADGGENAFAVTCIFFAILTYVALEVMVTSKKHFNSGVDDALMWMTAIFFLSGLNIMSTFSMLANSVICFLLAMFFAARFRAVAMSAVAGISLLAIFFFTYIRMGEMAKLTMPFLILIASAILYFTVTAAKKITLLKYHLSCLVVLRILFLITIFISGNYFIVREAGNEFFDAGLIPGQAMPFGWLFWTFTYGFPLLYIVAGTMRKDRLLLRVGLLLLIAMVLTVRYYHFGLPIETFMVLAGGGLIAFCVFLMRYLKQPRHGFTFKEIEGQKDEDAPHLEALIIAGTFAAPQAASPATQFGGGSGGGAGASGEF